MKDCYLVNYLVNHELKSSQPIIINGALWEKSIKAKFTKKSTNWMVCFENCIVKTWKNKVCFLEILFMAIEKWNMSHYVVFICMKSSNWKQNYIVQLIVFFEFRLIFTWFFHNSLVKKNLNFIFNNHFASAQFTTAPRPHLYHRWRL